MPTRAFSAPVTGGTAGFVLDRPGKEGYSPCPRVSPVFSPDVVVRSDTPVTRIAWEEAGAVVPAYVRASEPARARQAQAAGCRGEDAVRRSSMTSR